MTSSKPITLFDIASGPPLRTFAPNPWKARYALNFKRVPYQTKWIHMPDIASVRQGLGMPANRTLPDGTPYHTLPVIQDSSTGELVGDTFEIALYLDKTYPTSPRLIPAGTEGLTAAFNAQVDGIFTTYVILADRMPFDASVADKVKDIFAERFGATAAEFEQMKPGAEEREKLFIRFERALGELSKAYLHVGGTTDYMWAASGTQKSARELQATYLDGDEPAYADFIVGAWLAMLEASMESRDWQRVCSWQDGRWARLHKALAPFRTMT